MILDLSSKTFLGPVSLFPFPENWTFSCSCFEKLNAFASLVRIGSSLMLRSLVFVVRRQSISLGVFG